MQAYDYTHTFLHTTNFNTYKHKYMHKQYIFIHAKVINRLRDTQTPADNQILNNTQIHTAIYSFTHIHAHSLI